MALPEIPGLSNSHDHLFLQFFPCLYVGFPLTEAYAETELQASKGDLVFAV